MQDKIKNPAGETVKAGCVVVDGDRVILVRGYDAAFWEFPKGHAEAGESAAEVAMRETEEETGYRVEIVRQLPDVTYTNPDTAETVRSAMFTAKIVAKIDEGEKKWQWWPITEARGLVYPNLVFLLDDLSGSNTN